jgi:NADPH:quinone reductase-like Zn-dependent oxidoreductase
MKAIVVRQPGGPEQLRLEEVPAPQPGAGEVLVALRAAALNRRDILMRSRPQMAEMMPFIPGSDGAGLVAAVGPGVTHRSPLGKRIKEGDEVVIYPSLRWGIFESHPGPGFEILGGPTDGTYAQFIRIPAENVFPKPPHLSFEEAAAFPLAGLTAWRALITKARLAPGERVFIPGAGSGVATFALQIAKLAGAGVYVSSHSDAKLQRALELGADGGVNYTRPDWPDEIKRISGGGFEVVIDSVGAATFNQALDLLVPGGRMVTFGTTSGSSANLEIRQFYHKQISLLGTTMGSPKEFVEMLAAVNSGKIRPVVDRVFPLGEAGAAHARLEGHEQFGKILLRIDQG